MNELEAEEPELVNEDLYGEVWMIEVQKVDETDWKNYCRQVSTLNTLGSRLVAIVRRV